MRRAEEEAKAKDCLINKRFRRSKKIERKKLKIGFKGPRVLSRPLLDAYQRKWQKKGTERHRDISE
jgi:hypothetical protein